MQAEARIEGLASENEMFYDEKEEMKTKIAELKTKNEELAAENARARKHCDLQQQINVLRGQVEAISKTQGQQQSEDLARLEKFQAHKSPPKGLWRSLR